MCKYCPLTVNNKALESELAEAKKAVGAFLKRMDEESKLKAYFQKWTR